MSAHAPDWHAISSVQPRLADVVGVWARRQKHREEVLRLKQELQALQSTSKGGQQATDRTKKDLEKTKCAPPPPCTSITLDPPLGLPLAALCTAVLLFLGLDPRHVRSLARRKASCGPLCLQEEPEGGV